MQKRGATFDYPFEETTRVYRVANKIFALIDELEPLSVNLKCNPIYALELRSLYSGIVGGYHMNKKHWNTVALNSDVKDELLFVLIEHSYELVFKSLPKRVREAL
ncbi:MAG: hypothetical protein RL154_627 [Pseudomonadota bacterium]